MKDIWPNDANSSGIKAAFNCGYSLGAETHVTDRLAPTMLPNKFRYFITKKFANGEIFNTHKSTGKPETAFQFRFSFKKSDD